MLATLLLVGVARAAITPTDPRIAYVGHFDFRDAPGPAANGPRVKCDSASKAPKQHSKRRETGHDFWQAVVDGSPSAVLALEEGFHSYTVNLGSSGVHELRLIKRTEPFVGTTQFLGFDVPGGRLAKANRRPRLIQVVGDSITCGYGNEGKSQNEHFAPATENAYMSYASIAARGVNADVDIIAWSGRKMWPDNTTPEIYDLALPTDPSSRVDLKAYRAPQAIVVNLATNDFGRGIPDEAGWTGAYQAFLHRLRSFYPNAYLYPAIGSMMSDDYPQGQHSLTTLRGYLTRMIARIGDPKIKLVEFPQQRMEDGLGSDWHPSVRTDEKMAVVLDAASNAISAGNPGSAGFCRTGTIARSRSDL